jgi:hypothetical protein
MKNLFCFFLIKIICIKVDVNAGSIIEVLGNVDNRNQIICDNIITFEPEQTANFGKTKKTKIFIFQSEYFFDLFRYGYVQSSCYAFSTLSSRLSC